MYFKISYEYLILLLVLLIKMWAQLLQQALPQPSKANCYYYSYNPKRKIICAPQEERSNPTTVQATK